MTPRETAEHLIAEGLYPIPLKPMSKEYREPDALDTVYVPEDFRDTDGVGIRLVPAKDPHRAKKIAALDLDCEEAIAASRVFAPATGMSWGRESKRVSQMIYECPVEKDLSLRDLGYVKTGEDDPRRKDSGTLVELLVTRHAMCPPSVHPSGEPLGWMDWPPKPGKAEPAELKRAAQLIATAAVTARYYAAGMGRHDWMMPYSGLLKGLGVSEDEALKVVDFAARWKGNDDEVSDRLGIVRSTYRKTEVTGAKTLLDQMTRGKEFLDTIQKIWEHKPVGARVIHDNSDLVGELNQSYAVMKDQAGNVYVLQDDLNPPRILTFDGFRNYFAQQVVVATGPRGVSTKAKGQLWLESPDRRQYSGIGMYTSGNCPEGYYNLWKGFTVEPRKGDWSLFREEHIRKVICAGDDASFEFVIDWLARLVQRPEVLGGTALAMRGKMGSGKSTFAGHIGHLFGVHYSALDSTEQLTGKFNSHMQNCILMLADEAVWPGDKSGIGKLRALITEPRIFIERKGRDRVAMKNTAHLMIATNEHWAVPAALDERRFAVFDLSNHRKNDKAFFGAVARSMQEGGYAAMLHDLLSMTLPDAAPPVPKNRALAEQKEIGAGPLMRWWREFIDDGDFWRDDNVLRGSGGQRYKMDRSAVYQNMIETIKEGDMHGRVNTTKNELGSFLVTVLPEGFPQMTRVGGRGPRYWVFPTLEETRKAYEEHLESGGLVDWERKTKTILDDSNEDSSGV